MGCVMAKYLWIMCMCVCEVCVRLDAQGTRGGQVPVGQGERVGVGEVCVRQPDTCGAIECVCVSEVCVRHDAHGTHDDQMLTG